MVNGLRSVGGNAGGLSRACRFFLAIDLGQRGSRLRTRELVGAITEVGSGKNNTLLSAQSGSGGLPAPEAKLIIAKLDRLSRNLACIATLMEAGAEFLAADNPHAQ